MSDKFKALQLIIHLVPLNMFEHFKTSVTHLWSITIHNEYGASTLCKNENLILILRWQSSIKRGSAIKIWTELSFHSDSFIPTSNIQIFQVHFTFTYFIFKLENIRAWIWVQIVSVNFYATHSFAHRSDNHE